MDTQTLRVKVGAHEFDAQGPPEIVNAQFEAWRALIAAQLAQPAAVPTTTTPPPPLGTVQVADPAPLLADNLNRLASLFEANQQKGTLSLRVHPQGETRNADAALLVVFGFKHVFQRDEVLAGHIKDALELSGIRLDRVDRTIGGYVDQGLLLKSGMGKGGKYRLTTTGVQRAMALAKSLSDQMA